MKKILTLLSVLVVAVLLTGCCNSCKQPMKPSESTYATSCAGGNCSVAKTVKGPDTQSCQSGKCALKKQTCKDGKCPAVKKACDCKQGGTCSCPAGKCQCKAQEVKKSCKMCEMKKQKMSCGSGKCGGGK